MAKKISALLLALLGSVILLFGCNDPYKTLSLSISKSEVVLYLNENGEQEGGTSSEYLLATVTGAGKNVSTDVTFSQYGTSGVNDIVSIEDIKKDGEKTIFNLKAKNPGRGIIYVNTTEGSLRKEINVSVFIPVKSISFVSSNKAVRFGGEVELNKYLTYLPNGTNQTEVSFFIDDVNNVVSQNENGLVTETTYAKIENGKLISKTTSSYPVDESMGLQYVNVFAISNYNGEVKTESSRIYVINVIDASEVALISNSDMSAQPITLVPSNNNIYDIILGKNSNNPFIFSRTLKVKIGSDFVTDKQYHITTSLDNTTSSVIGFVSAVSEKDRYSYAGAPENYPYKTYKINQQVKNMENNEEIFDINIDRVGFEGLFTLTFKVRVTVKEFGEDIDVFDESGENVTTSFASIYNVYGGNIAGTPLNLKIYPETNIYKIKAKVINAPQVNGRDGFEIYLRNNSLVTPSTELNGGTTIYVKHNYSFADLQTIITNPNQAGCPKLVLEYSYNLAPTTLTTGYKTYTVTSEVPLVALAGITDVGFKVSSPIKINAVTGKAVGVEPEEGKPYEIVVGTIGEQKINLNTIIASVTPTSVNGNQSTNFNVFDNEYFKVEYVRTEEGFVNRLVLTPILQPIASTVDFVIKTKNNITKNIRVEIFVPLVYENTGVGVNQEKVNLEVFEDEKNRGAIYDNNDKREYFIGVNTGYISIIPKEEVLPDSVYQKSAEYKTQNAVTVAVNSTIGFNIYNYVVQTINNEQILKEINYNENVNVVVNRNYFSVEYKTYRGIRTPFITTGNAKTEAPIDVRFVITGYDKNGNFVTLTKIVKLTIIKPITSIQLNPIESTIYEKSSVGCFKPESSQIEFNLSIYPLNALSSDEATKPNISFRLLNAEQVIKTHEGIDATGANVQVRFVIGDFVKILTDIDNYKCSVYAEMNLSVINEKIFQIQRANPSFSLSELINEIYNEGNLIAVVSANLQQYNKPIISSNANVNVKYAKRVNNIIASVDENGVYFDSRDYTISGSEIVGEGKEIAFEVEPSNAYNKKLIAFISNTSIAKIISGVDSNNRIIANRIVVKPYVNAGRTTLFVAAEDSYVISAKTGNAEPTVYTEISIRVANGTKEYPFEISNAQQFLRIGRDINLGNNSYFYVLSESINLKGIETLGETLPPFKKFNGGLSGLFNYSTEGINYSRQNYIYDFNLTKQFEAQTSKEYNIGLFEELSETAQIDNLIFEGVKFDLKITNTNHDSKIDVGVIAGRNYGSILNSRVEGTLNVNSETKKLNLGGMVGESFTYETHEIIDANGELDYNKTVTGVIAGLPQSTTTSSSSKINSEIIINHIGAQNATVNIGGVAGAAYTYAKHVVTQQVLGSEASKTVAIGYDFKNENLSPEPDVSVYVRESEGNYNNLNVVSTISSVDKTGALLEANVGGAMGYVNSTYLSNVTVAPVLMAKTVVGGLVGYAEHSVIDGAVVEFANAGQLGVNTLSLISEQYVGGLVGYGNNVGIYYSYVRSYFNNSGINNTSYYGNIALKQNSEIEDKYAGGLVGYLTASEISEQRKNYGLILTGEVELDATLKAIMAGSDEFEEFLYNSKYSNAIYNSYFSADINLTYQTLSGTVYAGGLVGGTTETVLPLTIIDDCYVVGNIKTNSARVEVEEFTVDITSAVGKTVEYKVGGISNASGVYEYVTEGHNLVKIETVVSSTIVAGSNPQKFKASTTFTVYENVGAFVGNETIRVSKTLIDVTSTSVKSEDCIEEKGTGKILAGQLTTTTNTTSKFEVFKDFSKSVQINNAYIASNNFVGVTFNNKTGIFVKGYLLAETKVEIKTKDTSQTEITNFSETDASTNLALPASFKTLDSGFNIIAVDNNGVVNTGSDDVNMDYSSYKWLHFTGTIYTLNNGYPVLFKHKHPNGEILFKVLPTNINANILNIENKFSNLSYIKQGSNKVVLFKNTYLSGKGYKNVNKYKLLVGEELPSKQYVNMAQIVLDLPNLNNIGITAEYASDLVITSSNINVVKVLNNMVIETLAEGVAVLRFASKLDISIYDEITMLVVCGVSDYNVYKSKNITADSNLLDSGIEHTQFIDKTSNYFVSAINRDVETTINIGLDEETNVARGYNGQYLVNPNIGAKLYVKPQEANEGSAKINGVTLESGKTYLFNSLSEFNFTGIASGIVEYEITPFIKLGSGEFGQTLTSTSGTEINNCVLIDGLNKTYRFNIKPKAESLTLDKNSVDLEPAQQVELNISVVTSHFALVGEDVKVEEDVSITIKENSTNKVVGSLSVLNPTAGINSSLINIEVISISAEKIYKYSIVQKVKANYKIKLSFNTDAYKDRTGGVTYNLNNISYSLTFSPSTNLELSKQFNIKIVPKPVKDVRLKFYANSELTGSGPNAEFNPQEVETNFIVPSRLGLLKLELFPEFNETEFVELSINNEYKNYVSFTQKLAVMKDGENGYVINYKSISGNTEYLPGFVGVKLVNQTMLSNSSIIYNGNYYVQISLDQNTPVNTQLKFTAKAFKTVDGAKVELYSKDIVLTVQPLPSVNLTVNGAHHALINVGGRVELTVEAKNFEGDIEFDVTSGKNNSLITLDYDIETKKYFIVSKTDSIPGDTVTVIARVSRFINGIKETKDAVVTLSVVEYIINGIRQHGTFPGGGSGYSLEMLNGTNQILNLSILATYNNAYENVETKIATFGLVASGRMAISGSGSFLNNWYVKTGDNNYEILNFAAKYDNFAFLDKTLSDLNATHYFALNAKRVATTDVLGAKISYYYNDEGVPTLYTGNVVGFTIYEQEFFFDLVIKDNSTYDHPNPIANVAQFKELETQTSGHYILTSDINLTDYVPFAANFASLDGNGHFVTINNFDTSSFNGGSNINCGLFTTISNNTVIKNLTLDVANLLLTNSEIRTLNANGATDENGKTLKNAKINLGNINSFNFGMLAGTNYGSVTNIKVVNTKETNALDSSSKHLFIYSTLGYITNSTLVDGNVGGIVGSNEGIISNSYIGLNAPYYNNEGSSTELRSQKTATSVEVATYPFFIVGGKSIGAVANKNSGIIANTYNLGVGLVNSSIIFNGSKTAGFVVTNTTNGYIFNSMVEGIKTSSYRANAEIYLEATGDIGGFIYENEGRIENAYSNISIKTNSGGSGGFVFFNKTSGSITNAYSTSPNAFNSKAHGQFTGINSRNKFNNEGKLTSCYYVIYNTEVANEDEPAQAIRGKKIENSRSSDSSSSGSGDKNNPFRYTGSFNGFSFATGSDVNNIWSLGENENFGPRLINLVSFNTFSHRTLVNTREDNGSTIYDYNYDDYCMYGAIGMLKQIINPLLVNTAEEFVKFIVNNAKTVLCQYTDTNKAPGETDEGKAETLYLFGDTQGIYYVRLINDLNFENIVLNNLLVDRKRISDVTFGGVLDGNGMSMKGIKLTDLKQDSVHENFGLFKQIGLSDSQKIAAEIEESRISPSIQNVNITINGFAATQSVKVGALAGSIYDTSLINITLSAGENVEIVGRNLVGGFAGLIVNKTGKIINNITTNNITVTSSYRSANISEVGVLSGYGFVYEPNGSTNIKVTTFNSYHKNSSNVLKNLRTYSYAGSIAGVIDASNREEENTFNGEIQNGIDAYRTDPTNNLISKITVQGGGFIAAEQAGGLFGYVSDGTHIRNSRYLVGVEDKNSSNKGSQTSTTEIVKRIQQIRGHNYAGGIVGENYGMIEQVSVSHIDDWQSQIDKDLMSGIVNANTVNNLFGDQACVAIGGIAGFSDQGIIVDSYSKINVINEKAKVVGGLVGIATRNNHLGHVYTTGDVFGSTVIGGLVGLYNQTGLGLVDDLNYEILKENCRLRLDYAVAINNWGKQTEEKLSENIKEYYNNGKGGFFKYVLRMPEVGNQSFSYKELVFDTTNNTVTLGEDKFVNTGDINDPKTIKYTSFIGSLVGKVENGHDFSLADPKSNSIFNGNINTIINNSRKISTVNTGFGQYYKLSSVISSTLLGAKISKNEFEIVSGIDAGKYVEANFNEPYENPTDTSGNGVYDIIQYANTVGNQFHQNSIYGLTGKNSNMFGSFAWDLDDFKDISPDSGSKVWMIDENLLPAYIVGLYSNFNEIKTRSDLNNNLIIASNTKNQFYLLGENTEGAVSGQVDNDKPCYNYACDNIDNSTYADRESLFINNFEGTLIGNPNNGRNPKIYIAQSGSYPKISGVFGTINSATIQNIDFKIVVPAGYKSRINKKDESTKSFGLLAKLVKGSVISNVNVEIVFMGGQVNFDNRYDSIGLLFGNVEDSTLNNINVTLTFTETDPKTNPATVNAPELNFNYDIYTDNNIIATVNKSNLNFGVLVGSGFRTIIKDINIYSPLVVQDATGVIKFNGAGTGKKDEVNIGTIIGKAKDCSLQGINKNEINQGSNGEIKIVDARENAKYNVGGIAGQFENSSISEAHYIGSVVVGETRVKLNVGGIVGYANSSNLREVMTNYYNTLSGSSPMVNAKAGHKIKVYNDTSQQTFVGGVAGIINNSNILGNPNNNISSGNVSSIEVEVKNGVLSVGGIVGYSRNSSSSNGITQAFNSGKITVKTSATASVGGICGDAIGGLYKQMFNLGDITLEASNNFNVGGLFGQTMVSSSEKELIVEQFISYGDIYCNNIPTANKLVGGIVGKIVGSAIKFNYGYTISRVFNTTNNNSTFATSDYINGIGFIRNFDPEMLNNVFYVYEFFPYTNTTNLYSGSTQIGKVLIKSYESSVKYGGISYADLITGGSNNVLFRYFANCGEFENINDFIDVADKKITLNIPYLTSVVPVSVVYSYVDSQIANSGNKLNPIKLNASSTIKNNNYYVLSESGNEVVNKTYELTLEESAKPFGGMVINVSRTGVPYVKGFYEKTNNGILSNFCVNVSDTSKLNGAFLNINNGTILNVVTVGYITLNSQLNLGEIAMFVKENNSNIMASASSVLIVSDKDIASGFSGFVGKNNSSNCGIGIIKDCYSTSSLINSNTGSVNLFNIASAGIIKTNFGIVETCYYGGTFNKQGVGNGGNGIVYENKDGAKITNCYFDFNALGKEGGSQYAPSKTVASDGVFYTLTEHMLNEENFVTYALRTNTIPTSFENGNVSFNYGCPTIAGGIKIKTIQNISGKEKFVIWHQGQVNNLGVFDKNNVDYYILSNIDMTSVNKGKTDEHNIVPQSELKHNIDGVGHTISNLKINATSSKLAWFLTTKAGDALTISNLTLTNAQVTNNNATASSSDRVAIIVAEAKNLTLKNIVITGTSKITAENSSNVGGFIGYGEGCTIQMADNAKDNANIEITATNGENVGGIVGYAKDTKIIQAHHTQNITAKKLVGGIAGYVEGSSEIDQCLVSGTITAKSEETQGDTEYIEIDSFNKHYITNKERIIDASSKRGSYAGGIVGQLNNTSKVVNSYPVSGTQIYSNSYSGGVVGGMFGSPTISYSAHQSILGVKVVNANNNVGAIALGGIVGYMNGGKLFSDGNKATISGANIATTANIYNFAIGGIAGFQNGGEIYNFAASSNTISGSKYVGGAIGCQNSGSLTNINLTNNTLNYRSNKDMDDNDGDGKDLNAGSGNTNGGYNYYSVMAMVQGNDFSKYLGCITMNSRKTVDGYFTGTLTNNRLDEFDGAGAVFAVEYGGLDARSNKIDNGGTFKIFFGFIAGGNISGTQSTISVTGGKIDGVYDIATTYVVNRHKSDFAGANEWWWYLKKRKIKRTFNIEVAASATPQNAFLNGTNDYNKFVAYTETYKVYGRDQNLMDMPCANHSLYAFISAGYSNAYVQNCDPITYIKDEMADLFYTSVEYSCDYGYYVKTIGKELLQNLYDKHAYPGMKYISYQSLKDWRSDEQYIKGGWSGDMQPTDLNSKASFPNSKMP